MSIFGHLAAPVNGLCLITLCLLSAGLADGYNSFLSPQLPLICVEPVRTDATGQLVSDLYFVQLDAPTTYDGNSHSYRSLAAAPLLLFITALIVPARQHT